MDSLEKLKEHFILVTSKQYDGWRILTNLVAEVRRGERRGLYSLSEQKPLTPIAYTLTGTFDESETLFKILSNHKFGLYSLVFRELILPVEYNSISESDTWGMVRVWKGNECGLFSINAKMFVIPCEYSHIAKITDTLYGVWKGKRNGIFSIETQQVTWIN